MRRGLLVGASTSERVLTRAATCLVICRQISIANIVIGYLEAMIWTRAYSTMSNPRRLAAQGRARAMARAWGVTSSKQAVSVTFSFAILILILILSWSCPLHLLDQSSTSIHNGTRTPNIYPDNVDGRRRRQGLHPLSHPACAPYSHPRDAQTLLGLHDPPRQLGLPNRRRTSCLLAAEILAPSHRRQPNFDRTTTPRS